MDPIRFDALTRSLGAARSRRTLLRTLGGVALGALGLAGSEGRAGAAGGGNSACAHFCAQVFGADTAAADACTSQAAHGTGLCYECGPKGSSGGVLCNGTCCPSACECGTGSEGTFCLLAQTPDLSGFCRSDTDCPTPGTSCQNIDQYGNGFCFYIDCSTNPSICPTGSVCVTDTYCEALCAA